MKGERGRRTGGEGFFCQAAGYEGATTVGCAAQAGMGGDRIAKEKKRGVWKVWRGGFGDGWGLGREIDVSQLFCNYSRGERQREYFSVTEEWEREMS